MFETYISTRKAAELCQVQTRTIRRNCQVGKFQYKKKKSPRGKIGYLVKLESLPQKAQRKYVSKLSKAVTRPELKDMPEWRRAIAFERLDTLKKWEAYAKERKAGTSKVVGDFIKNELDGKVTAATLYRWKKANREGGVAALAPAWTNGREKFQEDKFSPEAKQWVADFWLHPNRPSMKLGYVELKEKAKKKGWAIPSYTTVKEYLNNEIPEAVKERHRRGRKSFEDKVLRPILRDPSDLKPMEVIESDHHQVDVAVKMPDGRVVFPWLTAWMCVRTRKILGWVLVSSPNSDSINISLYQTISKYGVPEKVHLDNGKDYRAKMFTGEGRKGWIWGKTKVEIDEKAFQGIYGDLGIDIMWATPYNAKTKIIERFFKTFRTEFSVYWRTYRGKDKTERPEELDKRIRKRDVVDFEYLKNAIHYWVDVRYNNEREHRGKGMELRTPNNVFFSMLKTKRAVREEELSLLCTREPKMKTVQNYGIDLFGGWYWNDKIQELYFGRKVGVRHREDDISQIYVFDPEGVFLGIAKRVDDGTWGMNEKDYKRLMQLKKVMRESVKNWEIEHMPVRMTEEEREALISKNEKEYIEPELKGKYINTKYTQIVADIVAEEELENMEEGKKKNANKNFNQIQATFFDDFDNLQKEEADDFILEFGRYE